MVGNNSLGQTVGEFCLCHTRILDAFTAIIQLSKLINTYVSIFGLSI